MSCLVSGLLTIGPRFGGAIDDAARYFQDAADRALEPDDFVEEMKRKGIRVPGNRPPHQNPRWGSGTVSKQASYLLRKAFRFSQLWP